MFGRKARKAKARKAQAQAQAQDTYTYSASDYTPHGVSVLFPGSPLWVRPAAWQSTRQQAEDIARTMLREHPEWQVQVIRK